MAKTSAYCVDCRRPRQRAGTCRACQNERRRLAAVHRARPATDSAAWREAHMLERGRSVPRG